MKLVGSENHSQKLQTSLPSKTKSKTTSVFKKALIFNLTDFLNSQPEKPQQTSAKQINCFAQSGFPV